MNYFESEQIQVIATKTSVKLGDEIVVNLKIHNDFGFVNEAKIIMNQKDGKNAREFTMKYDSTEENVSKFSAKIILNHLGIHYYCIKLIINGCEKWIKYNQEEGKAIFTNKNFPYWSITVCERDFEVPDWAKGKIMYHVFVDRFYKSDTYNPEPMENRITKKWGEMPIWYPDEKGKIYNNDFFMGNLRGIQEKIPYLKELGVQILYLSPICRSQSNHRYDTADYENVDPYLGSNSDLQGLCKIAHENGINIIIDAVFNHTGNDSKYFNEYGTYNVTGAYQSSSSPYYSWYRKKENGEFDYWWGFKNLPVCDGNNPQWQQYIYGIGGVIDKWFNLGIDGLRLDVADELTDDFIENIRIAVKRNKEDGFILGEVWENAITKEGYGKQRTYLLGKGLDSVMNYPFTNAILKFVRFGKYKYLVQTINEILTQYPIETVHSLMNSLSTHDITRAITTLVADGIQNNKYNLIWDVPYSRQWQFNHENLSNERYEKGVQLLKVATVIQYFLPGNACVFYGDEVGMYGYKDPFNRKCFPWDNMNVDLFDFFCKLGKIKNEYQFLRTANLKIIYANDELFAFERYDYNNKIKIIVNRTEKNISLNGIVLEDELDVIFSVNSTIEAISKYGILIFASK